MQEPSFWKPKVLRAPIIASFDITYRCNLKCVMCHAWPESKKIGKDQELSREEIVSAAKHISEKYGVRVFRFLGGEPLIRKDLIEIVRDISSFATTLVTTNGLLLDEPTCRALINAGLTGISISLDGPRENCDTLRGKGVYERVLTGLRTLLRVKKELGSNIKITIGIVVTKLNLHQLEEAAKFANELDIGWNCWPMTHFYDAAMITKWKSRSLGFEHPYQEQAAHLMLDVADMKVFWNGYYKLIRSLAPKGSRKMIQGWIGPLMKAAMFDLFMCFLFRNCQRFSRHMIIGPSGEIYPCEFMRSISLGNVKDRHYDLWNTLSRVELKGEVTKRNFPVCQECKRLGLYRYHF